jgi:hypothetical protein
LSAWNAGENRTGKATMRATPASSQACTIASASSVVVASGFSQSTWAPAAAARSTSSRCFAFSEHTITASGFQARSPSYVST